MRIAAVIPTFNYGRYLARAIDSVQNQTRPPDEIIVIDDGSTDDTDQVLARYADAVRVLRTPRVGVSKARNAGWRASTAELIALLDADDCWLPTKLARQLEVLAEHPATIAVGCGNRIRDASGRELLTRFYPNPSTDRGERLRQIATRRAWVGSSNSGVLVARATLDQVGGFDESLSAAEDWDLWLRLAALGEIRNVHEVLSEIHFHRTGTFRGSPVMEQSQWKVLDKLCAAWPQEIDDVTRRHARALILRDAAGECLHNRDRGGATRRLAASLWSQPRQPAVWDQMMRVALGGVVGKVRKWRQARA
ncbi:MAG TPA: glycosyltransferase family A protein [Kofleriaceae bacterium]|nr:glycosyltransferase family A protein [Kofleriaceae bacterium]